MWLRLSTTLCLHTLLRSELRVRAAAICSSLGNEVPGISCCPDQLDEPRVPRADGRAELLELEWLLNRDVSRTEPLHWWCPAVPTGCLVHTMLSGIMALGKKVVKPQHH